MNGDKKLLKSILGNRGFETLEKAIFKQRTQAVIDPLEYYLPLIVVPRTIISWLIQNVKPMKSGDIKDIKFPGRDDIMIHVEKQDIDQYRAEFVSGGKVIHTFEKQSLPAASAHLMTVGELYDSFAEDQNKTPIEPTEVKVEKTPQESMDVVRQMMSLSNCATPTDSESIKWEMSHANVRELTGIIGKLVDTLAAKQIQRDRIEDELDKASEKEVKDTQGSIETSTTPEEKAAQDIKAAAKDQGISYQELDKLKAKDSTEQTGPTPKVIEEGEEAAKGKIQKDAVPMSSDKPAISSETITSKPELPAPEVKSHPENTATAYFKKKAELLLKPYRSDAQRRWAHTSTGTKALGGKEAVKHWDKESKGKDLPEKVTKAEMPKGAGQPTKPAIPQAPKPPVPPSNQPAQSAAKQAQSSARGSYAPPKTPGAAAPKNPTVKPKTPVGPKMAKGDYFKKMLNKASIEKSDIHAIATESQLFKSTCPECGKAEFTKGEDGNPSFNPCACFMVLKKDEEGRPYKFVTTIRKSNGSFGLSFAKDADPEVVKIFLLTLKAQLLLKKTHGK